MPKTAIQPIEITEDILAVLERAQAGDQTVLPDLQRLLDERPDLWRHFGDVARHAEDTLLSVACGGNLLGIEAIRRQLDALRQELTDEEVTPPLERLLIQRIVLAWLEVHYLTTEAARLRADDPVA